MDHKRTCHVCGGHLPFDYPTSRHYECWLMEKALNRLHEASYNLQEFCKDMEALEERRE